MWKLRPSDRSKLFDCSTYVTLTNGLHLTEGKRYIIIINSMFLLLWQVCQTLNVSLSHCGQTVNIQERCCLSVSSCLGQFKEYIYLFTYCE